MTVFLKVVTLTVSLLAVFTSGKAQNCIPAQLVINELKGNIANGCDLLELRVTSPGTMENISLQERGVEITKFTAFDVNMNDLIVVHFDRNDVTCNPDGGVSETTSANEHPATTISTNYDGAYDWYIDDAGITQTDNVFTLLDPSGTIIDVVLVTDAPTGTSAGSSEAAASVAANAGEWEMVGGGVPAGGFVDDDFSAHAVDGLDETGSIQRANNNDNNVNTDWSLTTETFGTINSGQTTLLAELAFPTVTVSSAEPDPTTNLTFDVIVTFSTAVCGFEESDLIITHASINSFTDNSDHTYTINVTASPGSPTFDVNANAAVDAFGTGNQAATQYSLEVTSSETDIETFSLSEQTGPATISSVDHTVMLEVPNGTDVSSLVPTFTLSAGANAKVGATAQVSGVTSNNFTDVVVYAITAHDGTTTQNWTVTVTIAFSTETDIETFSLSEQTGSATISSIDHTIMLEVPNGTDVSSLVSTFTLSAGANAKVGTTAQVSGVTANNFTDPVIYAITAQDGSTTQNWTVTVTIALSTETDIETFSLSEQTGSATISAVDHTIMLEVPRGTDLNGLVPTFTLSAGANAKVGATAQVSGVTSNDFTDPVTYIVTAEDVEFTQNWVVTVSTAPNTETGIVTFSLPGQTGPATISSVDHTLTLEVANGTNLASLVATFSLSEGASAKVGTEAQVSEVTANDFSNPVTYTVTAEDGMTTQDWNVTVSVEAGEVLGVNGTGNAISIYPNPFSNELIVQSKDHSLDFSIRLMAMDGRILNFQKLGLDQTVLDLSHMRPGIYVVQLFQAHQLLQTQLVLKK